MTTSEMAELYEQGATVNDIANVSGHSTSTVSVKLRDAGVEMRSGGRPRLGESPHVQPQVSHIEPRYSCGHKKLRASTCTICETCQCPPRKRILVRSYGGLWLDRMCGKLTEERARVIYGRSA